MKTFSVTIEGLSPLLQHRYIFKDEIEASSKKRSGAVDYSEEWKKALYWDKKEGLYQPATHIEGCLIKAAVNFQITGRSKKTYKDLMKSVVFVKPDIISYGYKEKTPEALLESGKIAIHKSTAVVQRNRIERLRPMLPIGWKLQFVIEVFDDQLLKDALIEILNYGGRFVGIGDFRPRYGRFSVVKFQ